ncbi:MAG: hypothetical protein IJ489_05660 [Clostridia bacterium]|nr:hypothetical protein [Clostridia bacterium]
MADFLLELIVTLYAELMVLIVPEEKRNGKAFRTAVAIFAGIMILGLMAMAMFGIYFVADGRNPVLGWILLIGAIVLSVAQITVGIILKSKKDS